MREVWFWLDLLHAALLVPTHARPGDGMQGRWHEPSPPLHIHWHLTDTALPHGAGCSVTTPLLYQDLSPILPSAQVTAACTCLPEAPQWKEMPVSPPGRLPPQWLGITLGALLTRLAVHEDTLPWEGGKASALSTVAQTIPGASSAPSSATWAGNHLLANLEQDVASSLESVVCSTSRKSPT